MGVQLNGIEYPRTHCKINGSLVIFSHLAENFLSLPAYFPSTFRDCSCVDELGSMTPCDDSAGSTEDVPVRSPPDFSGF